jgi:hypothetical protein
MTPNAPGLKVAGKKKKNLNAPVLKVAGKKKKNLNTLCLEWSEGGSETMLGRLPFGEER